MGSNILKYNGRTFHVGSYAVHQSLDKIGFTLSQLEEAFDKHFFKLVNALIFYSAEYHFLRQGKPCDFKETDVYDFLDKAGGYNGPFIKQLTLVLHQTLNVDGDEEENAETSEADLTSGAKKKQSPLRKTA